MSDETRVRGHVTTEATGKGLKLQQLLAVLLLIVGFMWAGLSAGLAEPGKAAAASGVSTGIGISAAGFVWYAVVRMMRWWHHG